MWSEFKKVRTWGLELSFLGGGEEIKDCSHVRKEKNYVYYVSNYAKLFA